ncbi:MAG: DUF7507 domain-containing protein, partial [Pseudomonadota bacterium]
VSTVGDFDNFFDNGETIVCTGSYVTTATDVTNGAVKNTAFATVEGFDSPDDSVSVPLANPALDTVKALSTNADEDNSGDVSLDDTLTYTVTVTNTGNVTL